jgi:putative transposon-encoded protein
MDILTMRKLSVIKGDFTLTDEVEIVFEKTVTPFGNSAKLDVPKRYLGKRAYVLILNDGED